ncbi:signal peptidase II [Candidatus Woesearchaeota archaeon]|nr:signal peptidase II [Candidatus Woesearchaeota archaeon]
MVRKRDFIILGSCFVADLLTKFFVSNFIFIEGILSFKVVSNTGLAFSFFNGLPIVALVLNVLTFGALFYFWIKEDMKYFPIVIGGALGNLFERIFFGHVTDFISVGTFAIFNLADTLICIGIGLTIVDEIRNSKLKKKK